MAEQQLTLPGVPLSERRQAWREHTSERWRERDPDAVEECVHRIRCGEVNQTHLAAMFGVSTNTIHALMMEAFSVEELQSINAKAASIASMQATAKITEVMPEAKVKDLGAVAMAAKQTWDMAQVGSGGPTEIREERHVLTVEDFEELAGTGFEGGKMGGMPPVIDVESCGERLGNILPPSEGLTMPDLRASSLVLCLFYFGFTELLSGFLNRGGGGCRAFGEALAYISSTAEIYSQWL
jgi:hypothetical protein